MELSSSFLDDRSFCKNCERRLFISSPEVIESKLEECLQRNDKVGMQVLTSEIDATRYRLEMQAKVSQYKATISDLRKRLNFTRQSVSQRDSTLERFQTKLSRLRIALTTEIDRMKRNEQDIRLKYDLLKDSVLEYKSNVERWRTTPRDQLQLGNSCTGELNKPNKERDVTKQTEELRVIGSSYAISKDKLFSILEEIQGSSKPPSPSMPTLLTNIAYSVMTTDGEDQDGRRKFNEPHIYSLVGMLSEHEMNGSTDDELSDESSKSRKECRISICKDPPMLKSEPGADSLTKSSQTFESLAVKSPGGSVDVALSPTLLKTSNGCSLESNPTPTPPTTVMEGVAMSTSRPLYSRRSHSQSISGNVHSKDFTPYASDQQFARNDSDTDDSDFEMFIPPKRRLQEPSKCLSRKRDSDEQQHPSPVIVERGATIMSSPTLSKRPVWYNQTSKTVINRKSKSEGSFNVFNETQKEELASHQESSQNESKLPASSDSLTRQNLYPSLVSDKCNKNRGDVSSDDNTKDTLVRTQLHQLRAKVKNDDTDLTSSEVVNRYNVVCDEDNDDNDSVGSCTYLDPKDLMDYCSDSINRKVSQVISDTDDHIYLTLTDSNGSVEFEDKPKLNVPSSEACPIPLQEGSHYLEVNNTMMRWGTNRDKCYSDYSTDTSSGWGGYECDMESDKPLRTVHSFKKREKKRIQQDGHELATDLSEVNYAGMDPLGHNYSRSSQMHHGDTNCDIYEAIDDLDLEDMGYDERFETTDSEPVSAPSTLTMPQIHSKLHISTSDPVNSNSGNLISPSSIKKVATMMPSSKENLYASLASITSRSSNWLKEPPSLPPRPLKILSSLDPKQLERGHLAKEKSNMPGVQMGPLPLYSAIENDGHKIDLVNFSSANPNSSLDDIGQPDVKRYSENLFSLGKVLPAAKNHLPYDRPDISSSTSSTTSFQACRPVSCHTAAGHTTLATPPSACMVGIGDIKLQLGLGMDACNGSGSEHVSPTVPDVSELQNFPFDPSSPSGQTFTPPNKEVSQGKMGYLKMMDPRLKTWKRRWMVLKDSELKYYKSNKKTAKGAINLVLWCRITKHGVSEAFQLETSKNCYHLLCKSDQECENWVRAIEATMLYQQIGISQKDKREKLSGWAQVKLNGESQRVWCALKGNTLDICKQPNSELIHHINIAESTVRKKKDSILLDSSPSHRNVVITIHDSSGVTEIQPEENHEGESWYYHLFTTKSGGMDLNHSTTERYLSEIERSTNSIHHQLWKQSIFNFTSGPLQRSLTTLPSLTLNEVAKRLFQSIQSYMCTRLVHPYDHHLILAQDIISLCLKNTPLQDELYCQILRQLSGNQSTPSFQVTYGWLLLSLIISSFLPTKPKFLWYLQNYLSRCCSSTNSPVIVEFAGHCLEAKMAAQEQGRRQCKPSNMEMMCVLESFAESRTILNHKLTIVVYLEDGTSLNIEFNPFTTIGGLITLINTSIDMPHCTDQTGFAIMCDWPGVDDITCCCPFPESKVVDVISTWSAALDELNRSHSCVDPLKAGRYQRNIQLTYKRRLFLRGHVGLETDKEAILLAYQVSKNIHSGEYTIPSLDKAIAMAAMLTQIEHGDWNKIEHGKPFEEVTRDAIMHFLPWKLTHLALDHDFGLLQRKLVEYWQVYTGTSRHECARKYISIAQEWSQYGSTRFPVEEYVSWNKVQRSVWLSISENGVAIISRESLKVLGSYGYDEISTFGGNRDESFMLVVFSQSNYFLPSEQHDSNAYPALSTQDSVASIASASSFTSAELASQGRVVEKLVFSMPRLKIFEVTFLIASYIRVNRSQAKELN